MADFDFSTYVNAYAPSDVSSDYNTAASYYAQAKSISQNVSVVNGRVELSPQAAQYASSLIATGIAAVAPELGVVWATFLAVAPQAGAGPGTCSTSPPQVANKQAPQPSELESWQYFSSWQSFWGVYPQGAPGSFEAFANPILQWNWELGQNCFSNLTVPAPALLATLIAAWNANHQNSSQLTIVRSGLNPAGFNSESSGYDPIANALESNIVANALPANVASMSLSQLSDAFNNTPHNVSSSFTINGGPEIQPPVHVVPLVLHNLQPPPISMAVGTSSSTAKKVVGVSAAAVGSLTVAAIVISLAKGKAWDWAFGQAWAEIKDVFDAGGPHKFLVGREANSIAEERSTPQSLLFSRQKYTPASAKAWARTHGYRSDKVDVTANYIRLRQQPPSKFRRIRTVTFGKGIKADIGFK